MHTAHQTVIRSVIRRAVGVFLLMHLVLIGSTSTALYEGFRSGELQAMKKPLLIMAENVTHALESAFNEPTPTPATQSAKWRKELDNPTPTPTYIQKRIYIQPTIIYKQQSQTGSQIDTDAWWKKAQEENAAKSAQSQQQLQQFQQQSQQNMQNFQQQAQQGMTDFQAQSDANVKAFQEKYGF